jgi:hypothetical protein
MKLLIEMNEWIVAGVSLILGRLVQLLNLSFWVEMTRQSRSVDY